MKNRKNGNGDRSLTGAFVRMPARLTQARVSRWYDEHGDKKYP